MNGLDDRIICFLSKLGRTVVRQNSSKLNYKIKKARSDTAIFFYHGWGGSEMHYSYLVKRLDSYNRVLFNYPRCIISGEPKDTIHYYDEILKKTKEAVTRLKRQGVKKFYLHGTSLGAFISVYVANNIGFEKLILNAGGSSLSETFWTCISMRPEKRVAIERGYTLKEIKKSWRNLEPYNNLTNIKNKTILMYISKTDMLVSFKLQKELLDKLKKNNTVAVKKYKLGHYYTALRSVLDYKTAKRFYSDD